MGCLTLISSHGGLCTGWSLIMRQKNLHILQSVGLMKREEEDKSEVKESKTEAGKIGGKCCKPRKGRKGDKVGA